VPATPTALALLEGCTPARLARLEAGLLAAAPPRPLLLIATLDAPGLLLGRHQRAAAALDLDAVAARGLSLDRRAGGGRAVHASPGDTALLLWVPPGEWLGGAPFPPEKAMNRWVRGLLAGLRGLGARSSAYFGRDVVSCDGRRLAVVSQAAAAAGGLAFEALVASGGTLSPPPGLERARPHPDARAGGPAPSTLGEVAGRAAAGSGAVLAAQGGGLEAALSLAFEPWEGPLPEAPPPAAVEDEAGLASGGEVAIPIGFVEALAAPSSGGLRRPRLRGEFLAPDQLMAGLEAALEGAPLDPLEVGRRVDAAFHAPGAWVHGVRTLASFAEAVLQAGRAPAG
jgi:hypothetical protein